MENESKTVVTVTNSATTHSHSPKLKNKTDEPAIQPNEEGTLTVMGERRRRLFSSSSNAPITLDKLSNQQISDVFDGFFESMRRLSMLTAIFEEKDLFEVSFHAFMFASRDLLSLVELIVSAQGLEKQSRTKLVQLCTNISHSLKALRVSVKQISGAISDDNDGDMAAALDIFRTEIASIVEDSETLYGYTIQAFDLLKSSGAIGRSRNLSHSSASPRSQIVTPDRDRPQTPPVVADIIKSAEHESKLPSKLSNNRGEIDSDSNSGHELDWSRKLSVEGGGTTSRLKHVNRRQNNPSRNLTIRSGHLRSSDASRSFLSPKPEDVLKSSDLEKERYAKLILEKLKTFSEKYNDFKSDSFSEFEKDLFDLEMSIGKLSGKNQRSTKREHEKEIHSLHEKISLLENERFLLQETLTKLQEDNDKLKKQQREIHNFTSDKADTNDTSKASELKTVKSMNDMDKIPIENPALPLTPEFTSSSLTYIDTASPFTENIRPLFEFAQRSDSDARNVEKHLMAIEKRQRRSERERAKTIMMASAAQTQLYDSHISTSKAEGKTISDQMAATLIQKIYRGHKARKQYKRHILRKHVSREIFDTEVTYVKGLLILYKQYVIPLRFKAVLGEPIIPKEKVETIFFRIRDLMSFNHGFLGKIERRVQKWNVDRLIGDIFIDCASGMDIYTHYVNNYNRAMAAHHQCILIPGFKAFLADLKSKQEKRSLGLLDLLITPVQRVPRYVLLLKELFKYTDTFHKDYENLKVAIAKLQEVAEVINESKRESELFEKVLTIHSKVTNSPMNIADPERRLLYEGELVELTDTGRKKQRHVYLFNDIIICTAVMKGRFISMERTFEFKWFANLMDNLIGPIERHLDEERRVVEDDIPPFAFGIRGVERRILLAQNQENLDVWMSAIASAKINYRVKKQSIIRLEAPQTRDVEKFIMRKIESDKDEEGYSFDKVTQLARQRMSQIENDIRVESKVYNSLRQRPKRENPDIIDRLMIDRDRVQEFLLFIEGVQSANPFGKLLTFDKRDCDRVLFDNLGPEERIIVKIFEKSSH